MSDNKCRNCNEEISQYYCQNCGEKIYQRINIKNVIGDFVANLIAIEGPILKTIKDLSLKPGLMINDYLNGKRKIYYKPFQYYLLATTVYFLFFFLWGDEMMLMFSDLGATSNVNATTEEINAFQQEFIDFQNKNMRLFSFFQVPIYAWLIWLFFGRRKGHTYTESLVVSLYITAQILLFGLVATFLVIISPELTIIATMVFTFMYTPWVMVYLYQGNKSITIIKSMAIVVIEFILFGILMIVISALWFILFRK